MPNGSPGPAPRAHRFRLVAFDQIRMDESAPYLVKGLIPREGLVVVYGAPKSGKSFWTFDLAMHVAMGWPYRGRRVTLGPVVYVACEGERGLGARVEAFRRAKMSEERGPTPFYLATTRLDLAEEHGRLTDDIRVQIGTERPVAVVIDTLNRSLAGSESSDQDMGAYIKGADAIREAFACAVVIIHHSGLEATRPRGHTSLAGAADAQIAVKRDGGGGPIVATVELMKDGPADAVIRSTLDVVELGEDEDGEPLTSCVIQPADDEPGPMTRRTAAPPRGARVALDLLRKALDEQGAIPPASNHIPHHVRAVRVDVWRGYCYAGDISAGETTDAKSKAFRRATKDLQTARAIFCWDDWVWLAD